MKRRRNSLLLSCLIWACIFLMDSISSYHSEHNEVASFTPDTTTAVISSDFSPAKDGNDFLCLLTFGSEQGI